MLLFNQNYEMGVFKGFGDRNELVIVVGSQEYVLELNQQEIGDVAYHLMHHENLLIPFNKETQQLVLNSDQHYDEEEMEELMNISEGADDHGEE
ncbi:hypothetical protein IQ283_05325 [Alkalihalobacillus hwajinpoensis]|uniref:hypothetical protein n=1 Tax=Guptibacillus hwajinpoensis TaxID=208199 RepID=UPI001883BCCD|nr:hypothetical protein [Pseudalkalibacillus hwajinpoensis]MBF0706022.1 hypothetical protein [Pseudalkalibacillus hwajinpoensis]